VLLFALAACRESFEWPLEDRHLSEGCYFAALGQERISSDARLPQPPVMILHDGRVLDSAGNRSGIRYEIQIDRGYSALRFVPDIRIHRTDRGARISRLAGASLWLQIVTTTEMILLHLPSRHFAGFESWPGMTMMIKAADWDAERRRCVAIERER